MLRANCLWILRSLLIFIVVSGYFADAYAQGAHNITLSGKVVDEKTGEALSGATVHILNTTHEVVSDEHGEFHFLTGQELPVTLHITYTGYKTHEAVFRANGGIILLQPLDRQLNELTVVG
ncbi:MAG TPA: carboxypeptidase-like regulatory domain-containing protein [Puia sp.]